MDNLFSTRSCVDRGKNACTFENALKLNCIENGVHSMFLCKNLYPKKFQNGMSSLQLHVRSNTPWCALNKVMKKSCADMLHFAD